MMDVDMRYAGLSINVNTAVPEFKGFYDWSVSILAYKGIGEETEVGRAELITADEKQMERDFLDIADGEDGDLVDVVESIRDFQEMDDEAMCFMKFGIIKRIEIDESYQNQGMGTKAMYDILLLFKHMDMELLCVKPYPISLPKESPKTDFQKAISQLRFFYERFSFQLIDDKHDHMVTTNYLQEGEMNCFWE